MKIIKVLYHDKELEKMGMATLGDWIDLRAAEDVEMKAGDYRVISLGVSMKLPDGYEAHLAPRSSTFKNWGILMTNSVGVIDGSFCGNDDIWGFAAYATRDTVIHKGDRICQFRILPRMIPLEIVEVESLSDESRGGFGSTGVR